MLLQVWFPDNYTAIGSVFGSLSAFDYFMFLLYKLPEVAFTSQEYTSFIATGAQVGM